MISEKSKKKIKEIKQLKENNWQKNYQTFTMYYKQFKCPNSHENKLPFKSNFDFATKILLFIKMITGIKC